MTFFAESVLDSPNVKDSHALLQYLLDHAAGSEMLRCYAYIAIGCVAALIAERIASRLARKALRKSSPEIAEKVSSAIRTPLSLLVFSYFFLLGFDAITGMPHELWMHVHENLYPIFNGLLILVCAFRLVDLIAQILRKRWEGENTHLDERWADLIGLIGKSIVGLGAGLFIIQKIDPSFNIIPLITGLSFVGAAVALASQKTIANAIGSMEIMIDKLFKEGDRISFDQYDGFVVRMGLRSITLASLTGEKINLPNKDLVDKQIRNYTRGKFNRTVITLPLYANYKQDDLTRAITLMDKTIDAHTGVDSCEISLQKFTDRGSELQALFWADYKTATEYNRILSEVNLALKAAFDEAGFAINAPPPGPTSIRMLPES